MSLFRMRYSRPMAQWRRLYLCAVLALAPHAAAAQNLIANPGFENSPPPNLGNNIGHPILPWTLGPGQNSNVVKVDGPGGFNYGSSGPESDADPATGAGVPQHYLDIAAGGNSFYQAFVVPTCGSAPGQTLGATYSGWFSTRDNLAGSGSVTIRAGTGAGGAILATVSVNLPAGNSQTTPWMQASGSVNVQAGATVSYVVAMDNNLNFDQAFLSFTAAPCATAPLTIRKTWSNATVNDRAVLTATRNGAAVDTLTSIAQTANETDADPTPVTVFEGETIVLTETLPGTNAGTYTASLGCTGGGTLVGNTLTVNDSGAPVVCTYTNVGPSSADLSITKTNNVSSVMTGDTTTYVVTATNNGSDAVTGAVVTDTPSAGLTCPPANPVTCTGAACPGSALTVADLTSGVALGTLAAAPPNNSATFSFVCTVN